MHTTLHRFKQRVRTVAVAAAASAMVLGNMASVSAAVLNTAYLELGDSRPGETNSYTFQASGWSATPIACVEIVFNDAADGSGSAPTGLSTTATPATFNAGSTSLVSDANWAVSNPSASTTRIVNTSTTEAPLASGNIVWENIVNGSTDSTTYYGLVTSYTDSSCTGGNEVDTAVTAFVYKNGLDVQLTVDPTLTFTCTALPVSTDVNGVATTHAPAADLIDFDNDVTSSTNGVAGMLLDVTTNASGGYIVYTRHTGQLTNENSDTIDNLGALNSAPAAFPAAGTEAWGYTTEDNTLAGGTADRFTSPASGFAGFTTSNEEITSNTSAVPGGESIETAVQAGVASTTEAGTYTTTIVYTVVATF